MIRRAVLFLAAVAAAPLAAQVPVPAPAPAPVAVPVAVAVDPLSRPAISGRWTYDPIAGGSEAKFTDAGGALQLAIRCTRATRRVSIIRPAMAAAPSLGLWTSDEARSLPAVFDPAAAQLRSDVGVFDRLLDSLAFSRGRFAVAAPGAAPTVVPNWPEATRAIEDCRN